MAAIPPAHGSRMVPPGRVRSVQALRAIAALFVVCVHATGYWHDKFDPRAVPWTNGNAGVDLFFVISGFIMVVSSHRLREKADAWRRFILLRVIRIVPLYWALTLAKLAAIVVAPALIMHTTATPWNVVASFLFIPSRDGSGDIRPVLPVGWTLSFEMMFYAVFAMALYMRTDALRLVGPVMLVLAALSLAPLSTHAAITSLANPIVLEFAAGVAIAETFQRGWLRRQRTVAPLVLAAGGLLGLALVPADEGFHRVIVWGGAGAATLIGAVKAEHWLDAYIPEVLVGVGEASYSLYLIHGFVIPVLGSLIARAGWQGLGPAGLTLVCVAVSLIAGLLMYAWVEAPVTRMLRPLADASASQHS